MQKNGCNIPSSNKPSVTPEGKELVDITAELLSAIGHKKSPNMSGNYRCPSEVDKPLNLFDIAKLQKVFEIPNKMAEKITSLLQFSASVDC